MVLRGLCPLLHTSEELSLSGGGVEGKVERVLIH